MVSHSFFLYFFLFISLSPSLIIVFVCCFLKSTGNAYAIKIIDIQQTTQGFDLQRTYTEIEILQSMNHPNIIKYNITIIIIIIIIIIFNENDYSCILLDYMNYIMNIQD